MFRNITAVDIFFAASAAFVLTQIILALSRIKKTLWRAQIAIAIEKGMELEIILERCRLLFPISKVDFHGESFQAGAMVRITTLQKGVFEGKLIGQNNENILCLMTKQYIIAHELNKILEIVKIEEQLEPKK